MSGQEVHLREHVRQRLGAVPLGHVCRQGTGRRSDAFRYWVPQRTDDVPLTGATEEELQDWNQRQMQKWLADLGKSPPSRSIGQG